MIKDHYTPEVIERAKQAEWDWAHATLDDPQCAWTPESFAAAFPDMESYWRGVTPGAQQIAIDTVLGETGHPHRNATQEDFQRHADEWGVPIYSSGLGFIDVETCSDELTDN